MKPFFTLLLPACFLFVGLGAKAIELISAQTRGNSNAVTVTFSADVTEASATNAANYSVNNGVSVSNVVMLESGKVRLFTSLITEGQVYTLTVSGVQDRAVPPRLSLTPARICVLNRTRSTSWSA